jgi:hypothetical protein
VIQQDPQVVSGSGSRVQDDGGFTGQEGNDGGRYSICEGPVVPAPQEVEPGVHHPGGISFEGSAFAHEQVVIALTGCVEAVP